MKLLDNQPRPVASLRVRLHELPIVEVPRLLRGQALAPGARVLGGAPGRSANPGPNFGNPSSATSSPQFDGVSMYSFKYVPAPGAFADRILLFFRIENKNGSTAVHVKAQNSLELLISRPGGPGGVLLHWEFLPHRRSLNHGSAHSKGRRKDDTVSKEHRTAKPPLPRVPELVQTNKNVRERPHKVLFRLHAAGHREGTDWRPPTAPLSGTPVQLSTQSLVACMRK